MVKFINEKKSNAFENNRKWFAIQTYSLKEQVAKVNFENQGFRVYLPQVRVLRKHARNVSHVKRAFFPGYLFLHLFKDECRWQAISSTRGVIRPVKFGDYYPPVPDRVIEDIYSFENEDELISLHKINNEKIQAGNRVNVSINSGIEQSGIFLGLNGNQRAIVLLDILKEQAKAVVPLSMLSLC